MHICDSLCRDELKQNTQTQTIWNFKWQFIIKIMFYPHDYWAACYINSLWWPPGGPSIQGVLAPPHPSQGHCHPSIDWAPVDIIHRCPIPRPQHSGRGKRVPWRWHLWGPPVTCPTVNFEVRCAWPGTQHSAEVLSHAHHASSSGIARQNWYIG